MPVESSDSEPIPTGKSAEFYGAVAGLAGILVNTFVFPAITAIELRESHSTSFLRSDDGNETSVSLSADSGEVEVRIRTDTFEKRDEKGLPIPTASNQYTLRIDAPTFHNFARSEHDGRNTRRVPVATFEHTELHKDGYSTQASIRLGGKEPVVIRQTAPLKQFDAAELEDNQRHQQWLVMLDDVNQYRGLDMPDTVKNATPEADEIASFVDLISTLSDNFDEVIPPGIYRSQGGKAVTVK